MYRRLVPGLALLCLAASPLVLPAEASAQPGSIRAGQTVRGELSSSDPTLDDGSHYDIWTYRGGAGETITITMRSDEFDAYLAFGQIVRGECEDECETDDDGAGGTDARLTVTLDEAGEYEIRANSLSEGETGAYTLAVEFGGDAPGGDEDDTNPQVRPIRAGQSVSGELDESDARAGDQSYYELWTYRGPPGQRITLVMRSDDFDAYLGWGRMVEGEWEELESDDDGAGGTDARLQVTLGDDGEYAIRANTLSAGESGSYTLSVVTGGGSSDDDDDDDARSDGNPGRITGAVRVGQTVSGRLDSSDGQLDDESYFDLWTYSGREGETVTITMRSDDFDTFLAFGRLEGGEFEEIEVDDDGAGGTDSQIVVTLPRAGTYVIRANSLEGGSTGAYTLRVASGG
ncbi:MAG TPA: hypothetical protein VFX98_18595 [Longimicrobiaceae bacterium]|nr:hypothetical protein [Longimicrobiaceae bacterium]